MDIQTIMQLLLAFCVGWLLGHLLGYREGRNNVYEWMRELNHRSNGGLDKLIVNSLKWDKNG